MKVLGFEYPPADVPPAFRLIPMIINGSLGGALGVYVVYPVDMAKTRIQNERTGYYKGLFDCIQKTYKSEGLISLYKGSTLNAVLMAPETAIKMTVNDFCRRKLKEEDGSITVTREIFAGGCAGVCQSFVTTPMELIKIQMQDHGRTKASLQNSFTGISTASPPPALKMIKNIVTSEEFSFYKGGSPTIFRNIVFAMIYFPLFANLNSLGSSSQQLNKDVWMNLTNGFVSASVSAALTTPMDVVKTRMQTLTKGAGEETYNGMGEAYYKILKAEGVPALFKGLVGRSMIVGPIFGISQMVYFSGFAEHHQMALL